MTKQANKAKPTMKAATAIKRTVDAFANVEGARDNANGVYKEVMAAYFVPTYGEEAMEGYKATKCRSEDSKKAHASDLGITLALLGALMTDQAALYEAAKAKDIDGAACWQSLKRAFFGRKKATPAAKAGNGGASEPSETDGAEGISIAKCASQSPTMAALALGQFVVGLNDLLDAMGKAGATKPQLADVMNARELCGKAVTLLRKTEGEK